MSKKMEILIQHFLFESSIKGSIFNYLGLLKKSENTNQKNMCLLTIMRVISIAMLSDLWTNKARGLNTAV